MGKAQQVERAIQKVEKQAQDVLKSDALEARLAVMAPWTAAQEARAAVRSGASQRNRRGEKAQTKPGQKEFDACSEVSEASVSTMATLSAVAPVLSGPEEREVRKLEKKLRDIAKLEKRHAAGEELDINQVEKVKQRCDVEAELATIKAMCAARAREESRRNGEVVTTLDGM